MLKWGPYNEEENYLNSSNNPEVRLLHGLHKGDREFLQQNTSVLFDSVLDHDNSKSICRLGRLRISRTQLRERGRPQLVLMYNVGYYPEPSVIRSSFMEKEDLTETEIQQILDGGEKVKTDFLIRKLYEKLIFDNKEAYDFMHAVPIIIPYLRKHDEKFESDEIFDVVKSLCYFLTRRQKEEVLIHMDKIFEDEN